MIQQTTLDAYQEIRTKLGTKQLLIYNVLVFLKEANNLMIARVAGLPINSVTPRVLELRKLGYVAESYKDKCPYTGKNTIFWRSVK